MLKMNVSIVNYLRKNFDLKILSLTGWTTTNNCYLQFSCGWFCGQTLNALSTFWCWECFLLFFFSGALKSGKWQQFLSRDVYVHSGKSGHWGNLVKWSHKKLSQLKKPHAASAAASAVAAVVAESLWIAKIMQPIEILKRTDSNLDFRPSKTEHFELFKRALCGIQ